MKKVKQNLAIIFVITIIMQSVLAKAQNALSPVRPTESTKMPTWNPIKLSQDGKNILNGVYFYSQVTKCNSTKVTLAKVVNSNIYAVNVSYQLSDNSPIINVIVPASSTLEGSCSTTDENLAKLVVSPPDAKTNEEKQKISDYINSHITVTKIQ